MENNEVYTTTFEDVDQTAQEFGRIALLVPEKNTVIILDDMLVGSECIKEFENTPYGLTVARRFAVRLYDRDEDSDQSFEELRADHIKEVSYPPQ